MANREALRELQSRLANRLQAARTEGVQASWLAVEAAGARYLFPLAQSGEIFPFANAQPVPYTHAWFLGVANLRGGLYGVVDLAGFVGGRAPQQRVETSRADARLVALSAMLEVNCALLIDRLAGLRGLDAFSSSSEPPAGSPGYFGSGYTDASGAYWQEINLQALSQQPQFLSISA
ncbi:chemotaxis protein CheW [Ramlibacter tataouinensis]|uniref:Candidate twitching motility protein, chemotaxis protein cheW n=1 Tax=Ramlibacter tataouinensis (strain ATCC BAA-407 / DSM 14655 / LMG 21543 / TTB310) TaxID=365046 RepID=F5XZH1_RAMTT|nr:chemotaxis protein CheW [Ramlibacter tataouinensis]AEG94528.1 Candidate twitching motility protein, chemotaxis protein cheW [Ramlibacter tataouinensis TTB310]